MHKKWLQIVPAVYCAIIMHHIYNGDIMIWEMLTLGWIQRCSPAGIIQLWQWNGSGWDFLDRGMQDTLINKQEALAHR